MPGICTHLPSLQLKGNNEHCVNACYKCTIFHRCVCHTVRPGQRQLHRQAKTCRMEETMKFSLKHD